MCVTFQLEIMHFSHHPLQARIRFDNNIVEIMLQTYVDCFPSGPTGGVRPEAVRYLHVDARRLHG